MSSSGAKRPSACMSTHSVSDNVPLVKVGHLGETSAIGNRWDEKGHSNLVEIYIWHEDMKINSIQFLYAENGNLVLSERHGSDGIGSQFEKVTLRLKYPAEYITEVSGAYSTSSGYFSTSYGTYSATANSYSYAYIESSNRLVSLVFKTNSGRYGPFGFKGNLTSYANCFKTFCIILGEPCQFGGFYGTSNSAALASIGVYLKPNVTELLDNFKPGEERNVKPKEEPNLKPKEEWNVKAKRNRTSTGSSANP